MIRFRKNSPVTEELSRFHVWGSSVFLKQRATIDFRSSAFLKQRATIDFKEYAESYIPQRKDGDRTKLNLLLIVMCQKTLLFSPSKIYNYIWPKDHTWSFGWCFGDSNTMEGQATNRESRKQNGFYINICSCYAKI